MELMCRQCQSTPSGSDDLRSDVPAHSAHTERRACTDLLEVLGCGGDPSQLPPARCGGGGGLAFDAKAACTDQTQILEEF